MAAISSLPNKDQSPSLWFGMNVHFATEYGREYYQFSKVAKGKWTIESSPPPEKKDIKEEVSIEDLVGKFIPQRQPALIRYDTPEISETHTPEI